MRTFHLTYVDAVATKKVKHVGPLSWLSLVMAIRDSTKTLNDRTDQKWPLFVPAKMLSFSEGAFSKYELQDGTPAYSRSQENLEFVDCIVLDIDNDPKHGTFLSIQDCTARLNGLSYIFYTSFNHLNKDKHGGVPKFRVLLPLANPATLAELKARKDALKALWPEADPAGFTVSQPFYKPVIHPDRAEAFKFSYEDGQFFDVHALPESVVPVTIARECIASTDEVITGLPVFRLDNNQEYGAAELYEWIGEYGNHEQCFRLDDPGDKKAGCFVYKHFSGLMYVEPGQKGRFIKVMKSVVDEDAERAAFIDTVKSLKKNKDRRGFDQKPAHEPTNVGFDFGVQDQVLVINERYLSTDYLRLMPERGVFVVKSPKGTGKTELLKKLVQDCVRKNEAVMLLGHRVFLLNNLATRTNLDFYRDLDDGTLTRDVAVCLNSLATRLDVRADKPYSTIIIDESEQVLQALTSRTLLKDLAKVFTALIWLFKKADRIICLDADLSADITIRLLSLIRGEHPGDDVRGLMNEYKIGEGRVIKRFENKYNLIGDALGRIEAGQKVYIATNNKTQAKILHAICTAMKKTCLLVSADTADGEDQQLFINDPEHEQLKYDCIVATPTLSTGVSIDGSYISAVYGLFGCQIGTFQDASQALFRVRNQSCSLNVWMQGNNDDVKVPSEETIREAALDRERGTKIHMPDDLQTVSEGEQLWANVYARIEHQRVQWSLHKDKQFDEMHEKLGFIIEKIVEDKKEAQTIRDLYAEYAVFPDVRAENIWNALDLSKLEFETLARKRTHSTDERNAIDKYRFKAELGEELTLETLKLGVKQNMLITLAKMRSIVSRSDDSRMQADADDRRHNKSAFTANKHRVMQHQLLQHLAAVANLDIDGLREHAVAQVKDPSVKAHEIGPDALSRITVAFAEREKDFNLYFNLRMNTELTGDAFLDDIIVRKYQMKIWNSTFGEIIGLHLTKKKKGPKGAQESKYFIDSKKSSLALLSGEALSIDF